MEMLSRDEAERRIRERAAEDPDFRAELMSDPRAALSSELGVDIPEQVSVHVHEESLAEIHVVLPVATETLSDEQLDMVSGGGMYDACADDSGYS
jgi:hypothetical protein